MEPAPLDGARERLAFHLEMQEGFWFAPVVSNDPRTRAALRAYASAQVEMVVIEVMDAPHEQLLQAVLTGGSPMVWVVADGSEGWEAKVGQLVMALNERREVLRKRPGALVLEGRERLKAVLRNLAPDLFSIRACVLETGTWPLQGHTSPDALPEPQAGAGAIVAGALRQAERLAGSAGEGAMRSRVGALTRAAEALIAQGWVTEASDVVEALRFDAYRLGALTFGSRWAIAATATAESLTGAVCRSQGDLDGAVRAFSAARWMRKVLDDGEAWSRQDLGRALTELGEVLVRRGELDPAAEELSRAVVIRERLVADRPGDLERASDLALSLSILGDLHLARPDPIAAREVLERALEIRKELALTGASRFRRYLGVGWGRMGALAEAEGDLREALRARRAAADLARDLAAEHPENAAWAMELAIALGRYGEVQLALGDLEGAGLTLEQASSRARAMADEDPDNARWQGAVAVSSGRLAALSHAAGDLDAARRHAERAVQLGEALVWQDPSNRRWQQDLAAARVNLAAYVDLRTHPR